MDTIKIKTFLLVAKYKNFSKVAEEFSYTPSAISHIADSLEEELGIKLFNRTNKGVCLTADGNKLYEEFVAVIDAEETLLNAAASLVKQKDHSLRIGTYSSIAHHFLPSLLQSFKKSYPTVKTTITVDDYMQNWIEKGKVDVILADQLIESGAWQPLMEDEYVVVAPKIGTFSKKEITTEELYTHTFIKADEANLNNYLDYSKFKEVIEVKSIENNSIIYMVKENLGITILPKLSIKSLPPGVKALKLNPRITRTIGIIYDNRHPTWACERFVKHIKKITN